MTLTEAVDIANVIDPDDDGTCLTCCMDDDTAICGKDVAADPWSADDAAITCARCIEGDEADVCPNGWTCPPEVTA